MKTFSEQYVFLVDFNLKKAKIHGSVQVLWLIYLFIYFCTILYEYLKILREDDPSMLVKTGPIHVNTEKNPDFFFDFLKIKFEIQIFISHV